MVSCKHLFAAVLGGIAFNGSVASSADNKVVIRTQSESGIESEAGLPGFNNTSAANAGAAATPTGAAVPAAAAAGADGAKAMTDAEIRAACFQRMAAAGITAAGTAGAGTDAAGMTTGNTSRRKRAMNLVELVDRVSRSEQLASLVDLANKGTSPLDIVRLAAAIVRTGLVSESGLADDTMLEISGAESDAQAKAFVETLKNLHAADLASDKVKADYLKAKVDLEGEHKKQLMQLEERFTAKRDIEVLRNQIQSSEQTLNQLRVKLQEAESKSR